MTNEQSLQDADNMAVVTLGGYQIILPIEEAVSTMLMFKKARRYEYSYSESHNKIHHIGGELPSIAVELMSIEVYTEGLINGPRKRS